ncbi:hypothetical protein ACKWTF_009879 [Chironomus riparius]
MLAVIKTHKFQHFFAQILKFSSQISTFDQKCQISLPISSITITEYKKIKIPTIFDNLRPTVNFYSKALKSYKQMKSSSAKTQISTWFTLSCKLSHPVLNFLLVLCRNVDC